MKMGEELRVLIQDKFADADMQGKVAVAKLYAEILLEVETQLQLAMEVAKEDR